VDTSAAAEAAESKRQEVEQTKQEYAEKLRLQMEQAEMLAREMRMRHIRGQ
jgi:phage terminase Nu1 subunit (DNA packaging protein)